METDHKSECINKKPSQATVAMFIPLLDNFW